MRALLAVLALSLAVTATAVAALRLAPVAEPWPGGADVAPADVQNELGGNVSGLDHESPATLWAVDNDGLLLRLVRAGGTWTRDPANGWGAGKTLRYPDGTGAPDAEGVTLTGAGGASGVYVSSERNGGGASRPSVLRYDVSGDGATLTATQEWDLTAALPPVGANAGIESITWVADAALTGAGLVDDATGAPYDPADYPGHAGGLFLVGLEADGSVHAFALQAGGGITEVTSFGSVHPTFAALHWDGDAQRLWVVCDDNCAGRATQYGISGGDFAPVRTYDRPAGMPDLNNEGFTFAPDSECAAGSKPVWWTDDGNTGGHALRAGTLPCADPPGPTPTASPTATPSPSTTPAPTPVPPRTACRTKRTRLLVARAQAGGTVVLKVRGRARRIRALRLTRRDGTRIAARRVGRKRLRLAKVRRGTTARVVVTLKRGGRRTVTLRLPRC